MVKVWTLAVLPVPGTCGDGVALGVLAVPGPLVIVHCLYWLYQVSVVMIYWLYQVPVVKVWVLAVLAVSCASGYALLAVLALPGTCGEGVGIGCIDCTRYLW